MLKPLRRVVRRLMERTGLIGPYYRWLERRSARGLGDEADDGRPMPPAELVVLVSGPSRIWFSERGRSDAAMFADLAARHGVDVAAGIGVLDFGCGAGRIARWLAPAVIAAGGRFHGSDLNPKLAGWCAANLPGAYATNGLQPPLALGDGAVDLVYAHSVLTHLTEATARAWLAEIARVLRPGGLALLTFHDEAYAAAWGPPDVAPRLAAEGYVVWNQALEGSNYMSAWTATARLAALAAAGFDVAEMIPGGVDEPSQAVAVLRTRT
ncbi:class I SAM-dependent methyltransferase [Phenylobacterium sp.]|uniref:class I SAM-dependent methyltransferase n=1 Tax=Phenylobacterium sp. TaxID=1871053 RepID=UPI0025F65533|nr:class I SAM-dependent methyltransferase [Phenylobacterium sp.]